MIIIRDEMNRRSSSHSYHIIRNGQEGCAVRTVRASHESFSPPLLLMLCGEQVYSTEGS